MNESVFIFNINIYGQVDEENRNSVKFIIRNLMIRKNDDSYIFISH